MNSAGQVGGADGGASNRHRPVDVADARLSSASRSDVRAHGRGALIALGVAAVGTVAFVVGLRVALQHLPPERRAAAVDTVRQRRFAPPAPNQPDEYPRLR